MAYPPGSHRSKHETPVEGCFGCHLLSLSIAPSVHATSSGAARLKEINDREKLWDKTMPAYKRLRAEGLQPRDIDSSAELEAKASDRLEVTMGHIFKPEELPRAREAVQVMHEMAESESAS